MNDNEKEAKFSKSKNKQIEAFLNSRYDIRFNIIKCRAEYRLLDTTRKYEVIGRFELNSLKRKLDQAGIITTVENIRSILESNFSKRVHPIKEYFETLPRQNPEISQWIRKLARTIEVKNGEKWEDYFTRWLVGVVANVFDDERCLNHLCLVLTGEQGKFKTTVLDHLCPTSLKSYLYTGKIDPQNKDMLTLIAEYLFINIDDQLKVLHKKDENELKNYITMPKVKYRRPYDIYIEEYPHLASFMASVNGNDFLTDPTGSRRFLPFEVTYIDKDKAESIDMDDVYSEVMYLYESNFRYWFIDNEVEELNHSNKKFHVQTTEYEMLMRGFEKPEEENKDKYFMTNAEIRTYLCQWTKLPLREKQMGEALVSGQFQKSSKYDSAKKYSVIGYLVRKIKPNPFMDSDL